MAGPASPLLSSPNIENITTTTTTTTTSQPANLLLVTSCQASVWDSLQSNWPHYDISY